MGRCVEGVMQKSDIQRLLTQAGYYKGAIDGIFGQQSYTAIDKIVRRHVDLCVSNPLEWSPWRQAIGAAQLILHFAGYAVGEIDGYDGNLTQGAFLEWNHLASTGSKLVLSQEPIRTAGHKSQLESPTQAQCRDYYGATKAEVQSRLVMIDLPFTMRIDYNLNQSTRRAQIHKRLVDVALGALNESLKHYGLARLQILGLDRTAGTFIWRLMRGGKSLSMHSYGCAWDFYASPNGLTTRCPDALFCGDDYVAWFDIWESWGWTSLGREIGRDWMHLQWARLK